jgi:hypothetical protein
MFGACRMHGEMINSYKTLIGMCAEKRPLGKLRYRWTDSIKLNHKEIGWCGLDSSGLG